MWNPTTTPSGILNNGGRKKERRRRLIPKIVVYLSCSAGARTSLGPIMVETLEILSKIAVNENRPVLCVLLPIPGMDNWDEAFHRHWDHGPDGPIEGDLDEGQDPGE